MTKSGLLETRSNLSEIVSHVLLGEEHVILRNNVPVAKIVPVTETVVKRTRALVDKIKTFRQQVKKVSVDELSAWKKEGRA